MILCLPSALILLKNGSLFIDTQKVFLLLGEMLRTPPMESELTVEKLQGQLDAVKKENELLRQELASLKDVNDGNRDVSFKEKYAVKILDSLPDMLTVFTHDEIGVEVVSSEETNHVGISNKKFEGMRMCDMIPAEAYQNVHANMQKVITTGKVSIAHHELQVNGERHCYENRIFPLDDKYVLVMCRDITASVRRQEKLRELNLLLEGILNNIPVYLFVKDPQNELRYLYWNKAFAEYSKIPATKAIGHTDFEIFTERSDAEKFCKDDLQLLRTSERIDMQETYVGGTGETRVVQTLKALVPMEGREPLLIGIAWDVTNQQSIEQELIKACIKAEQSDRLKTAFLANMSHEIRTPLNAIVGFSTLLASAETPEEQGLYSDIINQNSDILLQLINDILDLSKIEAGTLEYIRRPMDLGELCRTVYEVHKGRVREGVALVLDNNKEERLVINEDTNRITQVITNLITNAIKFTNRGEIRFGYEVKEGYIDFYVKDTGIGIEDDKVDHIFDRFVKLNSFVQGTGLGLAICRMIIEKIGGEISVISCLGVGSAFHFTIPYDGGKEPVKVSDSPKETGKSDVLQRAQQVKTILIAEDVGSNYFLLKSLLSKGYALLWAKDGIEVVDMFKEYHPDLILMDIKMPRMNGLEATRIIRSCSPDIPIIALTAYAFEADKEEAYAAGCTDFIIKPVAKTVLMRVLAKYSVSVQTQ